MASVTPICRETRPATGGGDSDAPHLQPVGGANLRELPSYRQTVTELSQVEQSLLAMTEKHQVQDEAIQVWYDSAPETTSTDRAYRSAEILTHDRDQALEAAVVYRRAAEIARRAGDATLAMEYEQQMDQFQFDLANAELGLFDLRQIIDLV